MVKSRGKVGKAWSVALLHCLTENSTTWWCCNATHLLSTWNYTAYFVFILKYPLLHYIHFLPLTPVGVNLANAHLISSPCNELTLSSASLICQSPSIYSGLKVVMFIIFIAILIASYYSPAPPLFAVIQNLLTTAASHWTATGTLIILQTQLFYLPPSPFMGSTGVNEDVFLITMRQRKLPHSVRIGLHACSTYGSTS